MGIQQRLLKARYSEYNLRMPHRDELNKTCVVGMGNFHRNSPSSKLPNIIELLNNPPRKDKYYKESHKVIMDDYNKLVGDRGISTSINKAVRNIAYFYYHPELYQNNLELFSIPFLSSIMFDIRQYNMNKLYKLGKLPAIWDKTNPASNGYYKLYKPMTNKCTILLSMSIIDILNPYVVRYIRYNNLRLN